MWVARRETHCLFAVDEAVIRGRRGGREKKSKKQEKKMVIKINEHHQRAHSLHEQIETEQEMAEDCFPLLLLLLLPLLFRLKIAFQQESERVRWSTVWRTQNTEQERACELVYVCLWATVQIKQSEVKMSEKWRENGAKREQANAEFPQNFNSGTAAKSIDGLAINHQFGSKRKKHRKHNFQSTNTQK